MADCVLTMLCPIDGLGVTIINANLKRNDQEDRDSHLHLEVSTQVTCLNVLTPHTWRVAGGLLLERLGG